MGYTTTEAVTNELAEHLVMLADNDYDLYRLRVEPITKNLNRKIAKGIFDQELACKLVKYLMDDVVNKNYQHFGTDRRYVMRYILTPDVRRKASAMWVNNFVQNNN